MSMLLSLFGLSIASWLFDVSHMQTSGGVQFWALQGQLLSHLLSILAFGTMLVTALRPAWLVQRLRGMDRLYRLHCMSGWSAVAMVFVHGVLLLLPMIWQFESFSQCLSQCWQIPLKDQLMMMGGVGIFCLMVFFMVTLIRALPYERFRMIYQISTVLFLYLIGHGLMLHAQIFHGSWFGNWYQLVHWVSGALALCSLLGIIKVKADYHGKIQQLTVLTRDIIELEVRLPDAFFDTYRGGQYVLLTLHYAQGALFAPILRENPDRDSVTLTVRIPVDDDYTYPLSVGGRVSLEGPYGRFYPPLVNAQEYWVAGQLGVVHFLSWMEWWIANGERHPDAHLFYCLQEGETPLYEERIEQLIDAIGAKWSLIYYSEPHYPDFTNLAKDEDVQFYFYGPDNLKAALQAQVQTEQLHEEFPLGHP